jgi:hypothetical protein
MKSQEAVVIIGAEQFSKHNGYAETLSYGGNYNDHNVGEDGQCFTQTLAIDALLIDSDPIVSCIDISSNGYSHNLGRNLLLEN